MNAITRTTSTGSGGLIPSNVPEALELARMMATCGMLPEAFRDKPGNALMVVEQAMRWGLSPFAVAQETSVIQGKTFYSGKIMAAAVNNYGDTVGRLRYEYSGAGDERSVRVSGQIRGETEPREVTVKLRDARTQNKNWVAQPDQQLAYHGARVWGRRHLPEVMLGAYAPEEWAEDERPIRPEKPVQSTVVHPARPAAKLDPVAAMKRVELDRVLENDQIPDFDAPKPDRAAEGVQALEARIRACQTEDELHAIAGDPQVEKQRVWLAKHRPELDELLAGALGERYRQITEARLEAEAEGNEAMA